MPSWTDRESWLEEDAPDYCRIHNQMPEKFVAFEGTNTGRRFYACSVKAEVINCGFVSWVDQEWSTSLQNALAKLWGMYHESNTALIDEKIENGKLVKEISEEKNKIQKKYNSPIDDVRKWMDNTERQVLERNYAKIKEGTDEHKFKLCEFLKNQVEQDLAELELQRNHLKDELQSLKEKQKADLELLQFREKM